MVWGNALLALMWEGVVDVERKICSMLMLGSALLQMMVNVSKGVWKIVWYSFIGVALLWLMFWVIGRCLLELFTNPGDNHGSHVEGISSSDSGNEFVGGVVTD